MSSPSDSESIRLNPDASDLACKSLEQMKLCYVSLAHFRKKSNGTYFTHHRYYDTYFSTHIAYHYGSSPINVILPNISVIEFAFEEKDNNKTQYLGKDNILYLISNYSDTLNIFNNSETSKFLFNAKFSNTAQNNVTDASCYFWKPQKENLSVICKLNNRFEIGEGLSYNIFINENILNYNNYNFIYYSNVENLKIKQTNSEISFLYSDTQEINMDDNTNIY